MGLEADELPLLIRDETRIRGILRKLRQLEEERETLRQEEKIRARTLLNSLEPISRGARIPLPPDNLTPGERRLLPHDSPIPFGNRNRDKSLAENLRRQVASPILFGNRNRDRSLAESLRRQVANLNRLVRRIRPQEDRIAIRTRRGTRPILRTHEVAVPSRYLN